MDYVFYAMEALARAKLPTVLRLEDGQTGKTGPIWDL